ncbi:trypsin-like serine peptidase [Mycolicibacterium vaccae]|uniref:trypsin-like serine peptidase n=1 Tax=Mycolicibacterium vaccae TaxID=1810 RepID=UPI003CF2E52F
MNEKAPEHSMLGPTSKDATGEDFTDAKGRRWVAVAEVTSLQADEVDVAESERERRSVDDYPPPGPDPRTLSRAELAERLRPRRLVGGYEYRLEGPDFETADLILGSGDVPNTPGGLGSRSAFARPKYIVGPDDRRRVENTRAFPGSAHAHLARQNCTATMIGPSTALCAAHCFFNNGWIPSQSITFGANTTNPTAPFGSFLADSLTLPGGWNGSGDWDWDFAVLEFSPSRPRLGDQTGWFGTGQNFNGRKTCIGYPTDKTIPSQWIKGGTFTATVGARYQHNLDIIPGDSGAGIYHDDDSRCNAIQSTQWFDSSVTPTRFWNEGRRWDSTTYNFFRTYGNWPRA